MPTQGQTKRLREVAAILLEGLSDDDLITIIKSSINQLKKVSYSLDGLSEKS